MKCTTKSTLVFALLVSAASLLACGTERIDANATYLRVDGTSDAATVASLDLIWAPDASMRSDQRFRVRIDGRWLLESPDNPDYVTFDNWQVEYSGISTGLALAAHTFQFVDHSGAVRLTTEPLPFTNGRASQLVVYGSPDKLEYMFFANSDAELASIPPETILARAVNLRPDRRSFPLRTCPDVRRVDRPVDVADCTIVDDSLDYAEVWQSVVQPDVGFGMPRDLAFPDTLGLTLPLSMHCRLPDSVFPYPDQVPVQIATVVWVDANPHFIANELSYPYVCW